MTKQPEALKLALEALDHNSLFTSVIPGYDGRIIEKAYKAINKALALVNEVDQEQSAQTDWEAVAADQAMTIALLKAEQPAQQQEPVAYMVKAHGMLQRLSRRADVADELACEYREDDPNAEVLPLYTSPPASKPLTDEPNEKLLSAAGTALEVLEKHRQMKGEYPVGMLGVRAVEEIKAAIEATHGITKE